MMAELDIPLQVFRYKHGWPAHFDTFSVRISTTASVLDAIELAWARHDRTLTFRHACHHASCGSCGLRVDGVERLPCVTGVMDVWDGHSPLRIEPLRNFPVVSDLVVDVSGMNQRLTAVDLHPTRPADGALPVVSGSADPGLSSVDVAWSEDLPAPIRFETCIECGLCMSACPTMSSDRRFLGPMGLTALYEAREVADDPGEKTRLLALADGEHGAWRCHSAFECVEVCPQGVDLPGMIMALRRDLTKQRLRKQTGRQS